MFAVVVVLVIIWEVAFVVIVLCLLEEGSQLGLALRIRIQPSLCSTCNKRINDWTVKPRSSHSRFLVNLGWRIHSH